MFLVFVYLVLYLYICVFVCMNVCTCMHGCLYLLICTEAKRWHGMPSTVLHLFLSITVFHWVQCSGFSLLGWKPARPALLLYHQPQNWGCRHLERHWLVTRCWDLNSAPYSFKASTLNSWIISPAHRLSNISINLVYVLNIYVKLILVSVLKEKLMWFP